MGILSRLLGSAFSSDGDNKSGPAAAVPAAALSSTPSPLAPAAQSPTVTSAALIERNNPADQQQQQLQQQHPPPHRFFSQRSARQLSLFLGGAGFFYWSLLISKRAIARHRVASQLKFYQPNGFGNSFLNSSSSSSASASSAATTTTNGAASAAAPRRDPFVAVEALNLATLNTVSFFIMALGGVAWGLDISDLEDMRRIARRSLYGEGGDGVGLDEAAEREVAEWVAKTLGLNLEEGEKGKDKANGGGGVLAQVGERKTSS